MPSIYPVYSFLQENLIYFTSLLCSFPLLIRSHCSNSVQPSAVVCFQLRIFCKEVQMKKQTRGKSLHQLWFVAIFSFTLCTILLSFDYSVRAGAKNGVNVLVKSFSTARIKNSPKPDPRGFAVPINKNDQVYAGTDGKGMNSTEEVGRQRSSGTRLVNEKHDLDSCSGRYIYVHDLPSRFNCDILKDCRALIKWYDMCPNTMNSGFGPQVNQSKGALFLSEGSWFTTNQFLLEVIFHERMKRYNCLTNDSAVASAIFVPFYAGLDVGRYLWDYNASTRDSTGYAVARWLSGRAEWERMRGRDHFFVAGRIAWDFRRVEENDSGWGSRLMFTPEFMNMTMLSIESTSWSNEFAVPYPTYFHPRSDSEVFQWQKEMKSRERRYLFAFAGAPRRNTTNSIRDQIINQCVASEKMCKLLNCRSGGNKCDDPLEVMKVFQDSEFCLQPPGDSYTRRSTFDSILAGCIPVFFHPWSAYAQYIWYLPKNYTKYSVYIPLNLVRRGNVSIEETLLRFTKEQITAMREEVVRLIPKVIYSDQKSRLDRVEDAFDVAVRNVLERVEKFRRKTEEGKDPATEFAKENSWRLKLNGVVGEHQLDDFF